MQMARMAMVALATFGTVTVAASEVFLPEGDAGTVLQLDDELAVVGRVSGLRAVHGLAVAPRRGLLIAGSLETAENTPVRPDAMSEAEHGAHHGSAMAGQGAASASIVSVVDQESGDLVRSIEVPGIVHHVSVDANEDFAVVTHPSLAGVTIIDLETFETSALVPTGPGPEYAVPLSEPGVFAISNAGNATISLLDAGQGFVRSNIKLEAGPKHMVLSPGGDTLLVALADAGRIAIVDPAAGRTTASYDVGGELHGVAFHGPHAFVSARERDRVVRIDVGTGAAEEVSPGPEPYHMTLVGERLLVSSSARPVVWAIDPASLDVSATVNTDDVVHQIVAEGPSQGEKE